MTTSVFYIESLEPLLVFGFIAALTMRQWTLYWVCFLLALGCKEDMPIYGAAYGMLLMMSRDTRKIGLVTAAISVAWLAFAVGVFIPWARELDGLAPDYAFVNERYGESPITESLRRVVRLESLRKLGSLTLAVGLICWVRPRWLLVAAPGLALNLAARDEALQAGLVGHYLWPILPFVFLAAIDGAVYLQARYPRLLRIWAIALLIGTIADNPVFRPAQWATRWDEIDVARRTRQALETIPSGASVLAQPQLIPHIAKRHEIAAVGRRWREPIVNPQFVVLSTKGDQWPLSSDELQRFVEEMERNRDYVRISGLPQALYVYQLRTFIE